MIRSACSILSLLSLVSLIAVYAGPAAAQTKAPRAAAKSAPAGIVNINTASVAELEALPGVGPKTAARIIEYRQKNGPFKKIEEIMNVRGVGEKSFLKLKSRLSVTGSKAGE